MTKVLECHCPQLKSSHRHVGNSFLVYLWLKPFPIWCWWLCLAQMTSCMFNFFFLPLRLSPVIQMETQPYNPYNGFLSVFPDVFLILHVHVNFFVTWQASFPPSLRPAQIMLSVMTPPPYLQSHWWFPTTGTWTSIRFSGGGRGTAHKQQHQKCVTNRKVGRTVSPLHHGFLVSIFFLWWSKVYFLCLCFVSIKDNLPFSTELLYFIFNSRVGSRHALEANTVNVSCKPWRQFQQAYRTFWNKDHPSLQGEKLLYR